MNKISKLFKKIPNSSFVFDFPPKKKLLVFDDESFADLKNIVPNYDYFLLQTRFEKVNKFYINPIIILKTIFNYRRNLWSAYLISIIEIVSPKVVITVADNSFKFFEIAKRMFKKINFCAIQNGARYDLNRFKYKFKKKITSTDLTKFFFIPNFFCFGNYEIDNYKKNNIDVQNFFPVGNLRLANFLKDKKKDYFKTSESKYDVCMISDALIIDVDKHFGTNNVEQDMGDFAKYIIKYCMNKNKKFICSFKRLNSSPENLNHELKYYRKYLSDTEYNFLINNSSLNLKKNRYLTYELMSKSEVIVSTFSTMLRENLAMGKKILSLNLMRNDIFDFPLEGACKLKRCSYNEFEKRMDEIISLDSNEYFKRLKGSANYLMEFDHSKSTINKIRERIDTFLK